jgi:hypothetical protein
VKVYAVTLKGRDEIQYFQGDSWSIEQGAVTLVKLGDGPVAVFPLENLISFVDLSANTLLDERRIKGRLEADHSDAVAGRNPGKKSTA